MSHSNLEQLADRIILLVRSNPKKKFELKGLVKKFKAGASDINAALRISSGWGYKFFQKRDKISFVSAPDILSSTEIGYKLKTKIIGRKIHSFNTVKSTNEIAGELADKGAVEGTIVTAEKQTLGKGRLGRSWHSPEKLGIYVSIILRPKFPPEKAPGLSIMSALAVAETLSDCGVKNVSIKWPNDVLINNKKTAGVLTELSAEKNKINHVIVGIGINVKQSETDFPSNIRESATSIQSESKKTFARVELFQKLLRSFEKEYQLYRKSQLSKSLSRIRKISAILNQDITLARSGNTITGRVVDIDSAGSLVVESNGVRKTVSSGEVTVVKK